MSVTSEVAILRWMRAHPGEWYTAAQIAMICGVTYGAARLVLYNMYYQHHVYDRRPVNTGTGRVFEYRRKVEL